MKSKGRREKRCHRMLQPYAANTRRHGKRLSCWCIPSLFLTQISQRKVIVSRLSCHERRSVRDSNKRKGRHEVTALSGSIASWDTAVSTSPQNMHTAYRPAGFVRFFVSIASFLCVSLHIHVSYRFTNLWSIMTEVLVSFSFFQNFFLPTAGGAPGGKSCIRMMMTRTYSCRCYSLPHHYDPGGKARISQASQKESEAGTGRWGRNSRTGKSSKALEHVFPLYSDGRSIRRSRNSKRNSCFTLHTHD